MWKDYSISYIKQNKASSVSIMVAALVSTLFLSLICSLFYNLWRYNIDQIIYEEGDWQGRLVGKITDSDIETIQNFANVTRVETYLDKNGRAVADIYFENMRDAYNDMPQIAALPGLTQSVISYHDKLLSQYLIFDPQDEQPPLLLSFYIFVMMVTCISLILMIRNAFAASMTARIHQLGILSSIGATPRQIKVCLLQEAFALCGFPVLLGSFGGIGLCICFLEFAKQIGREYQSIPVVLHYHPLVFVVTILASLLTVLLSAWLPARRMSRITPLQAIHTVSEQSFKKKKHSLILSLLFGVEGELVGNALKARRKELRISTISLTLSFFAFTMFLIFVTLSNISTKHTYFERYKDSWDVMATVKNTNIEEFDELPKLKGIEGVESCVAYQKAVAYTVIREEQLSPELQALGGIRAVAGSAGMMTDGAWLVKVPIVILDDNGFQEYCGQIGVEPGMDGAIVLNHIWDSINSNFRYPEYIPFITETTQSVLLTDETGKETGGKIKQLAYTQEEPILREEYEDYTLVQIIPASLWKKLGLWVPEVEADINLRILASDDSVVSEIESDVRERLSDSYKVDITNRIQDEIEERNLWKGYKTIVGALCTLLALIGIANIFSHTLGFLYQRKREFARYLSVGVTPAGIKKMLWIEVLIIAGRPLLITVPLAFIFTIFAITESYLKPAELLPVLPVLPIMIFILFIFVFIGLAYYIGGKRLLQCNLSEALQNDSMV
ncbi:MAG TPA: FtsX-like permease family protein [Clostridiales bacterium]|nr:FtsX-like permease family protein [Clostridiales bacterium]